MARNGTVGTDDEFKAGLSIRWDAGGGDSVVRFRNATEALRDWQTTLTRVTFQTLDAFAFIDKCKDEPGHGIFADPPWPHDGNQYNTSSPSRRQRKLAQVLAASGRRAWSCVTVDHP